MKTEDKTITNVEQIAQLFPNVVSEGKIDFDLLKQMLSDKIVESDDERYRLDWVGKKASLLKVNTAIDKTLRPCKEESVDFDNTENLYIEGDNFEVLKLLQESYLNKVKMIYIDPPYNTGKDFVYSDNFTKSKTDFEDEIGLRDEDDNKLFKNTDSNGRFHSDWLSMMYERLLVSRDLLKDDGVIFISIDDNEVHNLRKLCDEVFGESNFVGAFIWKNKHGGGGDSPFIVAENENILVFSKSITKLEHFFGKYAPDYEKLFRYKDERGKYYLDRLDKKGIDSNRPNLIYPIECPDGTLKDISPAIWRLSKEELKRRKALNNIEFKKDKNEDWQIYTKTYLYDENGIKRKVKPRAILKQEIVGFTQNGNKEVIKLFNKKLFDNPKPISLINYFLDIVLTDKNDLVLDFFSGSATTAHAVMQLNSEDGGNRKHIMVQLPELTDEKSEAYKTGYKSIPEIGKERIRRAGKKILEDNEASKEPKDLSKLDIGFRVLKIDSSNMKDVYYHPNELSQSLYKEEDAENNIKEDRTELDLLFQVMLDLGVELSLKINPKVVDGTTIYILENSELVACMSDDISIEVIEEIKKIAPYQVVLKDSCFKEDKDKINAVESLSKVSTVSVI